MPARNGVHQRAWLALVKSADDIGSWIRRFADLDVGTNLIDRYNGIGNCQQRQHQDDKPKRSSHDLPRGVGLALFVPQIAPQKCDAGPAATINPFIVANLRRTFRFSGLTYSPTA